MTKLSLALNEYSCCCSFPAQLLTVLSEQEVHTVPRAGLEREGMLFEEGDPGTSSKPGLPKQSLSQWAPPGRALLADTMPLLGAFSQLPAPSFPHFVSSPSLLPQCCPKGPEALPKVVSSLSKESCLGSKGLKSRYLNTSFSMLCSSWGSGVHSLAPAPCLLASNVSHSLTGSSGFLLPAEQLQRSRAALARTALAPPRLCREMWPGDAGERDSELSPTVTPCCVTEGCGCPPTSQAPHILAQHGWGVQRGHQACCADTSASVSQLSHPPLAREKL